MLSNRFVTAWANFCRSVSGLQSNEKSFQAWFASSLIQEFGLAKVYREVHFDKGHIRECFSFKLKSIFPELYTKLGMNKHELFPDVCITKTAGVDTRHTVARSDSMRHASTILNEMDVVTELKVACSSKGAIATQYSKVYPDILKLGLFMNAALASKQDVPLAFMCVLDNRPDRQKKRYVYDRYIHRLREDAKTWPKGWKKPAVLITAPIQSKWTSYWIDGDSDWEDLRVFSRYSML